MSVSIPRSKRTQYRHIEKSDSERNRSDERAREVATRTAMAQRREQEYGGNDGGGNDGGGYQAHTPSLEEKSVKQLRDRASELSIKGRSTMRKQELIRAIRLAVH